MLKYLIPLVLFFVLVVFLAIGLGRDPHEVPSPLINKAAPTFRLSQLKDPSKTFSSEDMRGKVWILNVWASWCAPCLEEHPRLLELSRAKTVPIVGLNYKDGRDAALKWLARHGDPYSTVVIDPEGRVGIDYGVYGVPETFVIDRQGIVRYKHIGPVTPEALQDRILPLVSRLQT